MKTFYKTILWIGGGIVAVILFVLLFKSCNGCNEDTTTNLRDAIKDSLAKHYDTLMTQREDSIKTYYDTKLAEKDKELAEIKTKQAVNQVIYIERWQQIAFTPADSVYKRYVSALGAFDTETVYPAEDYEKKYEFTSVEVKKSMKLKIKSDFLETENHLLSDKNEVLLQKLDITEQKMSVKDRQLKDAKTIIGLKEDMIRDLETRPVKVETRVNWFVVGGVAVGTALSTYAVIKIVEELKK